MAGDARSSMGIIEAARSPHRRNIENNIEIILLRLSYLAQAKK